MQAADAASDAAGAAGLPLQPGQVTLEQGAIDIRQRLASGTAAVRNSLKRVKAWTSVAAVSTDRPETNRHRTHRFPSSRNQGWGTRSNRRWLRGRVRSMLIFRPGSIHIRQTSR
ncbi:MAG: hypothetical protein EOO27_01800 [Comamonadaceae bacterium]|nr:MAG: hypothetical protein EOO27_01800 [Comamonadaceae bacterium]